MLQLAKWLWAGPYSLLGFAIGLLGICSGGGVQLRRGAVEFHGGFVRRFLHFLPGGQFVLAMTLGHTILGQSPAALDIAREHEHIHVRQFERWGFLMGPAYLGCSLWLWVTGRGRPYRDNPFEREAYDHDDLSNEQHD